MIRALIFDLDDTLYCEGDFLASGFRAVAKYLCTPGDRPWVEVYQVMTATLVRRGRRQVLPAALDLFPNTRLEIADLVGIYRQHTPEIRLFDGYAELLKQLRVTYRLGVVTDGAPDVQRAKCRALGLEGAVDNIICTWEHGLEKEKPHPFPFLLMLNSLQAQPAEALFIGDSLEKDCRGARSVGMRCARVEKPSNMSRTMGEEDADFVMKSLFELPLVLRQLGDRNEAA